MNTVVIYRVSSYSGAGTCVEAGLLPSGEISVRDTKNPDKEAHVFTPDEWDRFIEGVKAGEFDRSALPQPTLA